MGIGEVRPRAVFFDRDGVLNRAIVREGRPYPPSMQTLELIPGARELLERLQRAGFLLFVFTNQPDVARGTATREDVAAINAVLLAELPLEEILVCYHDDGDGCDCRKPLPGMIYAAAAQHHLDLARSYVVGDRWRDVGAGAAAGCTTIWLDMGYKEGLGEFRPSVTVRSLREGVEEILKRESPIGVL